MTACQCSLCQHVRDADVAQPPTVVNAGGRRVYVSGLGILTLHQAQDLTAKLLTVTGPMFAATMPRNPVPARDCAPANPAKGHDYGGATLS